MTIKFCHIYPIEYLERFAQRQKTHLVLAHLVEQSEEYKNFYKNLDDSHEIILDNSAFEMYKQGRPMYNPQDLLEMSNAVGADTVVLSDYPGEHIDKTIEAAERLIPEFKSAGLRTFFVPQSEIGQPEQLYKGLEYSLNHPDIDLVGLSILGCPNAYGVEKDNKLQRYLSRKLVLDTMMERNMLCSKHFNKFHCLGMTDGPKEISLLKDYHDFIYSWDSSAAFWAGVHGVEFDDSPTGLRNGKFEKEVDFYFCGNATHLSENNINTINLLCK